MSGTEFRIGTGQQIKALLLGAAVSAVLFSASIAVPFAGFVAGFLAAAPLCYTRLSGGRSAALLATGVAALLIAIGFKPVIGLWYLAQCGLIGAMLPDLLLRGMRTSSALLWSTAVAALATTAIALTMSAAAGQTIQSLANQEITAAMQQALKIYEQQQGLSSQDLELLKAGMQKVAALMLRIYPALATLNLLLVSVVTLLVGRRLAARLGIALGAAPFRSFRAPEALIWLVIVAGFAMLVPNPLITTPALNLLVVLLTVYFCQGLAVLLTLIARNAFSGMLQVLLVVMLITQPYLLLVVAVLGIFDLWGDFRTPRIKQDENL